MGMIIRESNRFTKLGMTVLLKYLDASFKSTKSFYTNMLIDQSIYLIIFGSSLFGHMETKVFPRICL